MHAQRLEEMWVEQSLRVARRQSWWRVAKHSQVIPRLGIALGVLAPLVSLLERMAKASDGWRGARQGPTDGTRAGRRYAPSGNAPTAKTCQDCPPSFPPGIAK